MSRADHGSAGCIDRRHHEPVILDDAESTEIESSVALQVLGRRVGNQAPGTVATR